LSYFLQDVSHIFLSSFSLSLFLYVFHKAISHGTTFTPVFHLQLQHGKKLRAENFRFSHRRHMANFQRVMFSSESLSSTRCIFTEFSQFPLSFASIFSLVPLSKRPFVMYEKKRKPQQRLQIQDELRHSVNLQTLIVKAAKYF
jgi:hypothetical protein